MVPQYPGPVFFLQIIQTSVCCRESNPQLWRLSRSRHIFIKSYSFTIKLFVDIITMLSKSSTLIFLWILIRILEYFWKTTELVYNHLIHLSHFRFLYHCDKFLVLSKFQRFKMIVFSHTKKTIRIIVQLFLVYSIWLVVFFFL